VSRERGRRGGVDVLRYISTDGMREEKERAGERDGERDYR